MNIVYIHRLNSDANSTKGILLENYCQQYHSDINVLRPDLNKSPAQVFDQLLSLIESLNNDKNKNVQDQQFGSLNTVLVGSSLGGYFSSLVSNYTGCPALLLNLSMQPHITLRRFSGQPISNDIADRLSSQIMHTTAGGWAITGEDLQWFAEQQLLSVHYPNKVAVWIKEGDELLNPHVSAEFYQQQGAAVTLQSGGDHRFSDFDEQLPMVIKTLQQL